MLQWPQGWWMWLLVLTAHRQGVVDGSAGCAVIGGYIVRAGSGKEGSV